MKKILLSILLIFPMQQVQLFSNGTNSILYGAASVAAGVGAYLSYRQAKKITKKLNNSEELAKLSAEEVEKMRNQLAVYYTLTGGCAATTLITGFLACKSCYGWITEPKLLPKPKLVPKLVVGKKIKIFAQINPDNQTEVELLENGDTHIHRKDETTLKLKKQTITKYKDEIIKYKKYNTQKYKKLLIEYKQHSFISNLMLKVTNNPSKLTTGELVSFYLVVKS